MSKNYAIAKEAFAAYGIDTDKAIAKLKNIPVSLHCWQGDDVIGFDHDGPLNGGIQTTGNYPGKATNPEQLLADMDKVISLCPGLAKINVHACYAIFEDGEFADRDKLEPKHFKKWVDLQRKEASALTSTPPSSRIPCRRTDLPFPAPTKPSASSGSTTVRPASASPSISPVRPAFPA